MQSELPASASFATTTGSICRRAPASRSARSSSPIGSKPTWLRCDRTRGAAPLIHSGTCFKPRADLARLLASLLTATATARGCTLVQGATDMRARTGSALLSFRLFLLAAVRPPGGASPPRIRLGRRRVVGDGCSKAAALTAAGTTGRSRPLRREPGRGCGRGAALARGRGRGRCACGLPVDLRSAACPGSRGTFSAVSTRLPPGGQPRGERSYVALWRTLPPRRQRHRRAKNETRGRRAAKAAVGRTRSRGCARGAAARTRPSRWWFGPTAAPCHRHR